MDYDNIMSLCGAKPTETHGVEHFRKNQGKRIPFPNKETVRNFPVSISDTRSCSTHDDVPNSMGSIASTNPKIRLKGVVPVDVR